MACAHGATYLAYRTGRGRRAARSLWWPEALLLVGVIAPTYAVRNEKIQHLLDWRLVFPLFAAATLGAQFEFMRRGSWTRAFAAWVRRSRFP